MVAQIYYIFFFWNLLQLHKWNELLTGYFSCSTLRDDISLYIREVARVTNVISLCFQPVNVNAECSKHSFSHILLFVYCSLFTTRANEKRVFCERNSFAQDSMKILRKKIFNFERQCIIHNTSYTLHPVHILAERKKILYEIIESLKSKTRQKNFALFKCYE